MNIQEGPLREYSQRVFLACGATVDEAAMVTDHLVTSSLMGFDSHGVMRIPQYVNDVQQGEVVPGAPVKVNKESASTAVLDCGRNFGQVGAGRAVQAALEKARNADMATVATVRCGHVGRLGAYTELAAREGFLALAACNSGRGGHFVLPWGGREGRMATNPISFAIPCAPADPIVADFSTSEVPEGVVRVHKYRGQRLPEKWIVDASGNPSDDPNDFYGPPRGAILPFGGKKGYRGYALSLLVETLGGILSGHHIREDMRGNGFTIIVIRVDAFVAGEQYADLIGELREYVKSSPPCEGFDEVLLPGEGDFEKKKQRSRDGIPMDAATWEEILGAGKQLGVSWGAANRA